MKGQAAMEYLMTYGWALFIIVIVAGALFYIISTIRTPDSCNFGGSINFDCSENLPQAYTENGQLYLSIKVKNIMGKSVSVHSILCTDATPSDVSEDMPGVQKITGNGSIIGAGTTNTYTLPCFDSGGAPISLSPGSQFKGIFVIWYNYKGDPNKNVHRMGYASVTSTVLK